MFYVCFLLRFDLEFFSFQAPSMGSHVLTVDTAGRSRKCLRCVSLGVLSKTPRKLLAMPLEAFGNAHTCMIVEKNYNFL